MTRNQKIGQGSTLGALEIGHSDPTLFWSEHYPRTTLETSLFMDSLPFKVTFQSVSES